MLVDCDRIFHGKSDLLKRIFVLNKLRHHGRKFEYTKVIRKSVFDFLLEVALVSVSRNRQRILFCYIMCGSTFWLQLERYGNV